MQKYCSWRTVFALMALVGIGMTVSAVALGQLLHLNPCPLCILQRMLYLLLGVVGVIGLLAGRAGALALGLGSLGAATAAAGLWTAGFQTWIQRFAPESAECSAQEPWWERLVNWAGEQVPFLFKPSGICSDPALKIIGLSIAEWSAVVFLVMLILSAFALVKVRRAV